MARVFARDPGTVRVTADGLARLTLARNEFFGFSSAPANLPLTGWWPDSYPGAATPWHGAGSDGPSEGRDLPSGGTAPAASATALNGFAVANLGAGAFWTPPDTLGAFIGTASSGWSFAMMVNVTTLAADGGVRYAEPALFASSGGYLGVAVSAAGFGVWQYDTGGGTYIEALTPATSGTWVLVQAKWDGANIKIRTDGGAWSSTASTSRYVADDALAFTIGRDYAAAAVTEADAFEPIFAARALSDAEFDALWAYAQSRYGVGAPAGYTLTADAGTFTETGTAAGLLAGRRVTADAGSFTETGAAAGLLAGRTVVAAAGAYTETGTDAGLLAGRVVTASAGTFTETCASAALVVARTVTASAATFAFTGTDAALLRGYPLTASSGSFTYTGTDAGLGIGRLVTADAASFSETGAAASLLAGRLLTASAGAYALTGADATLYKGALRILVAESGVVTATGAPVTFARGWISNVFNDLPRSRMSIDDTP